MRRWWRQKSRPRVGEQLLGALLRQRRPLQLEEQQRRLDRRLALLHQLQQRPVGRVGGVGREAQSRVGPGAADQLVDLRQLPHRPRKARAVQLAQLARVALGEGLRTGQGVLHPALDAGLALAVQQRLEVPGGAVQLGVGGLGGDCGHGERGYPSPSSGRGPSIARPMHETIPRVFLIARPSIDLEGMRAYLQDVGGESWLERRLSEAGDAHGTEPPEVNPGELLLEFGGRACYRSWEPGLNPNVSKIRTDRREYFANILRSGHGSVLEHASYSFAIRNCSRVFTHELVRHRAGSAFSQESLRYVRLTDIGFRVPPALEPVREQVISIVEQLEEFQVSAAAKLGIDAQGVPFHVKKEVTSALRRLAPIGLSTDIVWSANARTLRHVIEMRTAEGAEEELRLVFDEIARIMLAEAPNLFQDFVRQDDGSWVPENRKV